PLPVQPPPIQRARWPVIALALALISGLGVWLWISKLQQPPRPVIAICLFDNETGDPTADRIASGFSDALTAELASNARTEVIGNAAILRLPRKQRDLKQIQNSLNANYII